MLQQAILSSYHQNCPARVALSPRMVPWWNKELSRLKASTRWLFNQAKRTGDWESYKTALICYNKKITKAKQSSWRDYCRGIKGVPDRARLMRIMASQSANRVESIKLLDGQYTIWKRDPEGTIQSSFSRVCWRRSNLGRTGAAKPESICCCSEGGLGTVRQAISTFKPFNSARTDGIVPAILQQGINHLTTHLCHIFRACLTRGTYPKLGGKSR